MNMFGNRKQTIPRIFAEIIKNDAARQALLEQDVIDLQYYRALLEDRKLLRAAAEMALNWNTDKGAA